MKYIGLLVAMLVFAISTVLSSAQKKKEVEITQTLEVPKELPPFVTASTRNLTFYVSSLSAQGLLSQQVRDALKSLSKAARKDTIVKLRAFVSGNADMRRVRDIVSEEYTERKQPLPALTLVQTGALPLEGAVVVLEAVAVSRKAMNPEGLVFISGQATTSPGPLDPVFPLAEKSLEGLRSALKGVGSVPDDVLRVTCFLSSLDNHSKVRSLYQNEYPRAVLNYVQTQRAPLQAVAECEAIARVRQKTGSLVELSNPQGMQASPNYSQVALVSAPELVMTGGQLSFGYQDGDARLAFERLSRTLDQAGSSLKSVVFSSIYPLSASIAAQVRKIRFEFYDKSRPPASTLLPFEGLPSMDAGFAVDVVAVKQ